MIPESIKERISKEAEKFVSEKLSGWFPDTQSEHGAEAAYTAAAEQILSDPGAWGLAGVWVDADERLPEFEGRDKKYVVRYKLIKNEPMICDWDWINEWQTNSYSIEWLDESESLPPSDITKIEEAFEAEIEKAEKEGFTDLSSMARAAHASVVKQYIDRIRELEEEAATWKKLSHAYVDRIKELENQVECWRMEEKAYIAGGTAEAERSYKLVQALEEMRQDANYAKISQQYIISKIDKILAEYNQSNTVKQ